MKTTLAFLIGLGLGAWGAPHLLRGPTLPTTTLTAPRAYSGATATSPGADSLSQGLRALTGLHSTAGQIPSAPRADWRNWTDIDGRHVEARLLSRQQLTVTFETRDSQRHSVPIERLSLTDRVWLSLQ